MKQHAFSNAYNGVKKIRLGEILNLIAAFALLISIVCVLFDASDPADKGDALEMSYIAILGIGSAILSIIGLVIKILGISKASLDEPAFKAALYLVIAGIVVTVTGAFFNRGTVVKSILTLVTDALDLASVVFIIMGIRSLAVKLSDKEMDKKGSFLLKIFAVIYCIIIIAHIVAIFSTDVSLIFSTAAAVLSIVQLILYLLFLNSAKTMLE